MNHKPDAVGMRFFGVKEDELRGAERRFGLCRWCWVASSRIAGFFGYGQVLPAIQNGKNHD
jgi:hypothetical protein